MYLYLVTRWGNAKGGPNERDTNFLVVSKNYQEAAMLVDNSLQLEKNSMAQKFCHRITELGSKSGGGCEPTIILGPTIENAFAHDKVEVCNNKKWVRDNIKDGWIVMADYYETDNNA